MQEVKKIKVGFIGCSKPTGINQVWGGAQATINAFLSSFKGDPDIEIVYRDRIHCQNAQYIKDFLSVCDVSHVDDTSTLELMYEAGLKVPDIVGPIDRSPVKNYAGWKSKYTKKWFYGAKAVMRLNYAEEFKEGKYDLRDQVSLIRHGIDTERLVPKELDRKYVLWAGMIPRPAKNYKMMEDVMKYSEENGGLPDGYEFKVLSKFNVSDYWKALNKTAIQINTSLYESFCSAIYEAQAKGVPTVYRKNLHGPGVNKDSRIQVDYTPKGYYDKIVELLKDDDERRREGLLARAYVVKNFSYKRMNQDYKDIYKRVFKEKNND